MSFLCYSCCRTFA
jgi:hypothetical protein